MVDTLLNDQAITIHNQLRARHGCPTLTYDSALARSAQLWAETLSSTKCMRHSDRERYGENLAYQGAYETGNISVEDAIWSWYEQIQLHDFDEEFKFESAKSSQSNRAACLDHKNGESSQHRCCYVNGYFSQLIWKNTQNVGFGISTSQDGTASYFVAHYFPKGNNPQEFSVNVPSLLRDAREVDRSTWRKTATLDPRLSMSKKDLKLREKAEKKERERVEKERKEREKKEKKELKELEKLEKKRKSKL